MSLNINNLLEEKEKLSHELVNLDLILIKIKKLYYDTDKCISNVLKCSNKISELPIDSSLYNNTNKISDVSLEMESWKEETNELLKMINDRKEELNTLIEKVDKKIQKASGIKKDEDDEGEYYE